MTRFIQAEYPREHAGLARIEHAAETLRQAARRFDGGRASAALLLAAIVAALLVVANQVIEMWTEGHLLMAWVALWAVAFAALALFAAPVARVGQALRDSLRTWNARRRQAAEDRELWNLALSDERVMADLSCAMSRDALREARAYY